MQLKTPMQRREIVRLGSTVLFSGLIFRLVGCGQAPESPEPGYRLKTDEGVRYKTIKDIAARPSGLRPGILKARDIVKGEPVTLYFDEGGHRHAYTLTKEHFNQLLKGQVVRITTERVQGHTHDMVLDPNVNPANADSVDVPEDPPPAKMYAALSEKDEIYVQGSEALDPESVEYCLGTVDACEADQSLWKGMQASDKFAGRQVFKSPEALEFEDGESLNVRARTKELPRLVKLLLRISAE